MIDPLPQHPYAPGTRVHDAAETSVIAFDHGSAEILDARAQRDGSYVYLVRTDEGDQERWPSYFTIVAGTWPGPSRSDPLFGRRPCSEEEEHGRRKENDTRDDRREEAVEEVVQEAESV